VPLLVVHPLVTTAFVSCWRTECGTDGHSCGTDGHEVITAVCFQLPLNRARTEDTRPTTYPLPEHPLVSSQLSLTHLAPPSTSPTARDVGVRMSPISYRQTGIPSARPLCPSVHFLAAIISHVVKFTQFMNPMAN